MMIAPSDILMQVTSSTTASVPQAPILESDLNRGVGRDATAVRQPKQAPIPSAAIRKLWRHQQRPRTTLLDSRDVVITQDALLPPRNDLQAAAAECLQ